MTLSSEEITHVPVTSAESWVLLSGERVEDREPSHVRTGHPEVLPFLAVALRMISAQGQLLIETTVEMGEWAGHSACVPTGADNDRIFYAHRRERKGATRFVRGASSVRVTTIALGLHWDEMRHCYVLETAYPGVFAPPEPYDEEAFARRDDPGDCRREAYRFWRLHALTEDVPYLAETVETACPWPSYTENL